MQQADMAQGSNGLGTDVLRCISLQELDKRAQGHEDLVSVYLVWLQEHLNDWDLSDSAAFRPQVESWYASLRFHGYDVQRIRGAFTAWMSNQIEEDATCARRFLVVQEELLSILDDNQTTQPRDLGMDQGIAGVITVKEDKIIDVSSGDGDSDVEFLGWKRPESMRKSARKTFPPLTGANKETQRMQGTECLEPNDRLKSSKARKVAPSRIPNGKPPKGYVCGRCGEKGKIKSSQRGFHFDINQTDWPGHFKEQCPTNLDPSLDPKPTGGYQCYCCGAKEEHLTTLCPRNENPNSLTQQRIKAGVTLSSSSSPPRGADHYRPPYNQSRKAKKTPSGSMDSAPTSGNRRALGHFEGGDDDDHRMDPARRAMLEANDHRHSSPQPDDRMKGVERSHYSPPRQKRGRRSSIEESHRTKRARRWRKKRTGVILNPVRASVKGLRSYCRVFLIATVTMAVYPTGTTATMISKYRALSLRRNTSARCLPCSSLRGDWRLRYSVCTRMLVLIGLSIWQTLTWMPSSVGWKTTFLTQVQFKLRKIREWKWTYSMMKTKARRSPQSDCLQRKTILRAQGQMQRGSFTSTKLVRTTMRIAVGTTHRKVMRSQHLMFTTAKSSSSYHKEVVRH